MRFGLACALLLFGGSRTAAQGRCDNPPAGYVGVFGDSLGTEATIVMPPLTPEGYSVRTLYVVAVLAGSIADGFSGTEFRIEVTDPGGWIFLSPDWTADSVVGDPFDVAPQDSANAAGVAMGWTVCQPATGPRAAGVPVRIGTFQVLRYAGLGSTDLVVKQKVPPSNPNGVCPQFDQCNPPLFTAVPMPIRETDAGGQDIAFRSTLVCCDIPVRAAPDAWSVVKSLYR